MKTNEFWIYPIHSFLNETNAHCAALILDIARYNSNKNKELYTKEIVDSIDRLTLSLDTLKATLCEAYTIENQLLIK